jgi:hypothetical protein
VRTNTSQKLKRPLRSMKAFDRVAELYHIQLGHQRRQAAYAYSLLTGTNVMVGSILRYPPLSIIHG